jgi:hypothetical protein
MRHPRIITSYRTLFDWVPPDGCPRALSFPARTGDSRVDSLTYRLRATRLSRARFSCHHIRENEDPTAVPMISHRSLPLDFN